jgi:hypothetical protein
VNARGGQTTFVSVNQKQCHRADSVFKLVYHFWYPSCFKPREKMRSPRHSVYGQASTVNGC